MRVTERGVACAWLLKSTVRTVREKKDRQRVTLAGGMGDSRMPADDRGLASPDGPLLTLPCPGEAEAEAAAAAE